MNQKRSKELSIAVWSYLAEVPSIDEKKKLPKALYDKIKNLSFECPLCDTFHVAVKGIHTCIGCPIDGNCIFGKKIFTKWTNAKTETSRAKAARRMLDTILEWSPK